MKISDGLKQIGLTESEAVIYTYLLEHGISSPPSISKTTKIARPNAHHVLKTLQEKGLVQKQKKNKRFVYLANQPASTLSLIEKRKNILEEILPNLEALYKKQENKPIVKFYEGAEQLIEIFELVLQTQQKQVLGFASTAKLFEVLPNYFQKRYQKELRKREIFFKDILTYKSAKSVAETTQKSLEPYYEYKSLHETKEDLPTDILIWDDNVAILNLSEPVFGTILTNKYIADTFKLQFQIMWRSLS